VNAMPYLRDVGEKVFWGLMAGKKGVEGSLEGRKNREKKFTNEKEINPSVSAQPNRSKRPSWKFIFADGGAKKKRREGARGGRWGGEASGG